MPKPGEPEMRPGFPGTRVFLEDLKVNDVIDVWSRRSGSFILRENKRVTEIRDNGDVVTNSGLVMYQDAGWGEIRLKHREGE